jgi:hypothetical protein
MSMIVTMTTPYGIVMAADHQITQFPKREQVSGGLNVQDHINKLLANNVQNICDQIYEKNKNFYKPLTKSAKKLFAIGDNMAFSTGKVLHTKEFYPVELLAEQFCRKNTFTKPEDVAKSLFDFMCSKDDGMDLYIHLAGYNKDNDGFIPEFYDINIVEKKCKYLGCTGFQYAGANDYFTLYTERLASQVMFYTVQDAINICRLAIDMSRRLGRYLDFEETISEDEDVIAITIDGLQWIKRAKLEVR